jgi:hypothetical protein
VTEKDAEFFRVHGDQSNPRSPWVLGLEDAQEEPTASRHIDATGRALPPWNTQVALTSVVIPKGTVLFVGRAGDMTYTPSGQEPVKTAGGGLQVYCPELSAPNRTLVLHEYRRRQPGAPIPPAHSNDGRPQAPIKVRLDLLDPEPALGARSKGKSSRPTNQRAAPVLEYWFDQVSVWQVRPRCAAWAERRAA